MPLESHSEFLVLSGEGNPYSCRNHPDDIISAGCNFDWIPASLVQRLYVTPEGKIALPGLPPYEALLVGYDRSISLATAKKMLDLQLKGGKIAGRRPLVTPTMNDDMSEWNHYVNELFPTIPRSWRDLGVRPFADSGGRLHVRRRDVGDVTIYFLLNESDEDFKGDVSFCAEEGSAVELWKAEDGSSSACQVSSRGNGRVTAFVEIPAHRSSFAVASRRCRKPSPDTTKTALKEMDISCGWRVAFSGVNAPEGDREFKELRSWSKSDELKMRYFSGRARYSKRVLLTGVGRASIDLGEVHELANLYVNGRKAATLWDSPYRADISEFVKEGENLIEVEVINTWPNRLIGDAIFRRDHPGSEKMGDPLEWHAWDAKNVCPPKGTEYPQWVLDDRPDSGTGIWTWSNFGWAWSPDDPLLPAGLVGPVRIFKAGAK